MSIKAYHPERGYVFELRMSFIGLAVDELGALAGTINRIRKEQGEPLINESTAKTYIDGFCSRYQKVQEFFDRERAGLKKPPQSKRVVRSLLGRIRRFDTRLNPVIERKFRGTWLQQIEADLIKTAMLRLDRIFREQSMKAQIVMTIHDAVGVEAPHQEKEQVRSLLAKIMAMVGKLRVPLEVETK